KEEVRKGLQKMIAGAKKGPSFGLALPGKSTDDPVIETSRIKKGEPLMKAAKKAAGGSKATYGKLSFQGGKVFFHCQIDPPPGLYRKIKDYFRRYDVNTKPALVNPNGQIEDDDMVQPEDQTARQAALKAFNIVAKKLIDRFGTEPTLKSKVEPLIKSMQGLLAADPFDTAAASKLQQQLVTLAKTPAPTAAPAKPSANITKLTQIYQRTLPSLQALVKSDPSKGAAVRQLNDALKRALSAANPDEKAVADLVKQATQLLPKPSRKPAQAAPSESDPAAPAAKCSLAIDKWTRATRDANSELSALQKTISQACKGAPGASKVDKAFNGINSKLDRLQKALQTSLDNAVRSGDAASQQKAARDTAKLASDASAMLKKDPILSKIDENPFRKVRAQAGLVTCLDEISRELVA
ncbi:MAG: hypothetical protein AAGC81_17230, partial [Pseudomonadota bacterium]